MNESCHVMQFIDDCLHYYTWRNNVVITFGMIHITSEGDMPHMNESCHVMQLIDDCLHYYTWRNHVVIAFGTLSSFLT